jgi:hypothetical protein
VTTPLLEVDNLSIGYRTATGIDLAVDGRFLSRRAGRVFGAGG